MREAYRACSSIITRIHSDQKKLERVLTERGELNTRRESPEESEDENEQDVFASIGHKDDHEDVEYVDEDGDEESV